MVEADVRKRAVKNQRDEGVIRWALDNGLEPEAMLQLLDDYATVEDRLEFVDAVVWLGEEIQPVEPEVGHIEGRETGLFYRGNVNLLYGTDGVGKTLLIQKIIMQELEAGNEVMFLDAEDGSPRNMFLRLQAMGCDPSWGSRLHYVNIDKPPSQANRDMFVEVAKRCSLVVIDSAGELMGLYGKDAVKDLETRNVLFEMYGRPLAAAGAAVVVPDHIAKSSDGQMPIGSIRKRAGIDGAAYYLSVDEGNEWSKTKGGYGQLTCTKDRNGTYYRGEKVARVQVFPAAVSATGELVVELAWSEFDDMLDEDIIESPPAAKPLPDTERTIIDIVTGSANPITPTYLLTLLKPHGIEMTKAALEVMLKNLAAAGWLAVGKGGWRAAPLHSV